MFAFNSVGRGPKREIDRSISVTYLDIVLALGTLGSINSSKTCVIPMFTETVSNSGTT